MSNLQLAKQATNQQENLEKHNQRGLEPTCLQEALQLSGLYAKSGMFPLLKTDGQVMAVMAKGRELGIPMMTALTGINIIKGNITLSSALMQAVCLARPDVCEYFEMVESTNQKAVYRTKRKGRPEQEMVFTIEKAKDMGLVSKGGTWKSQPDTMLRWRAVSELARMVYPDLLAGCYTDDELSVSTPTPIESKVEDSKKIADEREKIADPILQTDHLSAIASVEEMKFYESWAEKKIQDDPNQQGHVIRSIENSTKMSESQKSELLAKIYEGIKNQIDQKNEALF